MNPSINNQWQKRERKMRMRIAVVGCAVILGFVGVLLRGVQLLIKKDENLAWVAEKQYQAVVPVSARRGRIFDMRGKELAVSSPVYSIYADGRMVEDPESVVRQLTTVLGDLPSEVRSQLLSHKKFVWVKRQITPDLAEQVKQLRLAGVRAVEESERVYPSGKLAGTVLGAVGIDSEGLAGLEMQYEKLLRSQRDKMVFQRDARGRIFYSPVSFKDQDDVVNITLALDKTIQFIAESSLDKAVTETKAKSGVVVVMDPKTGAILAMASSPSFNPNDYSKYPQSLWRNRAVTDTFEPGSTFKVLTVATALDQGLVRPEQQFDCMRGAVTIGNATIHDHDPYGMLSVRDIIKVSSNIGAYKVASILGKDRLYESLRKFGIGQKLGVDYPGEVNGALRPVSKWGAVDLATASFGQGVTATPLQITTAMATIANGGVRMKPYLVQRIENGRGELVFEAAPVAVEQAIRPETARLMLNIMQGVVQQGGTAKKAASEEFSTAGKTGTAQKVIEGSGKYAAGKFFASFVGVSPVEDPRLAVFVGIDEPQGGHYGGQVAAPVFREIVEASLHYMNVPGKDSPVLVSNEPVKNEPIKDVTPKKPLTQNTLKELVLPNMSGWTMRQVVATLHAVPVQVDLKGGGRAVEQSPAPGVLVQRGDVVKVRFELPQ